MEKINNYAKFNKYVNYNYESYVEELLDIKLKEKDLKKLNSILDKYNEKNLEKVYEPIIENLFVLAYVNKMSTSQLSLIYDTSIRTIQIWLKDLEINRTIKAAKKLQKKEINKNNVMDYDGNSVSKNNNNLEMYGIEKVEIKNLPESVIDFLNYLEVIKGKSINTIKGYEFDLGLFFKFLLIYKGLNEDSDIPFEEINIKDLDENFIISIKLTDMYAFLSFVEKQRKNGYYARARKVAALKSYFNYLHKKAKIITVNHTLELESPKINKRNPIYLNLDESINLLNSLDKNDKNYYRDHCILTLFLNCGMRLSELCSIRLDKIKDDTLSIIGKGNKERTVYLNESCIRAINHYMKVRDDSKCDLESKNYLLLSSHNKPINKRTVEVIVKKHTNNAGLDHNKYTPHKLRHTAATLMYKHGNVDIRSLQSILGHETISTTQIYTHVDNEILREAVKSNPLSKL